MIWIILLAFCLFDAWLNKWLEDHWGIVHWVNATYRLLFGIVLYVFFPMTPIQLGAFTVGGFCGYWQVFNVALNYLRVPRKPLLYVSQSPKAAVLDKLERSYQIPVLFFRGLLAVFGPIVFFYHPGFV